MMTFETLVTKLRPLSLAELQAIGHKAGVPGPTVIKIARGYTPNPGVLTVEKLISAVKRK